MERREACAVAHSDGEGLGIAIGLLAMIQGVSNRTEALYDEHGLLMAAVTKCCCQASGRWSCWLRRARSC
jgi:hypothetical protein